MSQRMNPRRYTPSNTKSWIFSPPTSAKTANRNGISSDDLDWAIGCQGVHGVFTIVDGLRRAGHILYEYRRGRYGDAAYYRAA